MVLCSHGGTHVWHSNCLIMSQPYTFLEKGPDSRRGLINSAINSKGLHSLSISHDRPGHKAAMILRKHTLFICLRNIIRLGIPGRNGYEVIESEMRDAVHLPHSVILSTYHGEATQGHIRHAALEAQSINQLGLN
jgi:hypothetical protein